MTVQYIVFTYVYKTNRWTNKLYFLKCYIINYLSYVQLDPHRDWIQWTHTYILKHSTHTHSYSSHFGTGAVYISCIHTFTLVWELWTDHLVSFLLAVHISFLLVAPQSAHFNSDFIAFCSPDCDTTFISSIESNARFFYDRWDVYALEYNPPHIIIHYIYMCTSRSLDL